MSLIETEILRQTFLLSPMVPSVTPRQKKIVTPVVAITLIVQKLVTFSCNGFLTVP